MPDEITDTSVQDDANFLGGGAEKVDKESEKDQEFVESKPKEPSEETDEKEEPEEEDEEIAETKEDLPPSSRPSIAQLKTAYPDIFKKFPDLQHMYFREAEYSKLYPTIQDAKESYENNEAFTTIKEDIFSGDGSKFFSAIKEVGDKEFDRFASNLLPTLYKVSPEAHLKAAIPLMENIVRSFYTQGVKSKSEDMKNAAEHLAEFLFNDVDIASGKKSVSPKREEESSELKEVRAEREKLETEKLDSFRGSVAGDSVASVQAAILEKLDPNNEMSKFIKETATERILKEVGEQMEADKDHIAFMNSLWSRAKRNGYTREDKTRITSAFLARAKSLIPSVRSKILAEINPRNHNNRTEKISQNLSRREPSSSGRDSRESNGKVHDARDIDWDRTSDEDFLEDRVTLKRR